MDADDNTANAAPKVEVDNVNDLMKSAADETEPTSTDDIIDQWFNEKLQVTEIARHTDIYAIILAAKDDLKQRIKENK